MLTYKASLVPCAIPNKFLQKLNLKLFRFLWPSKWERVARAKLYNTIEEGGINMIKVENYIKSLRLTWAIKILNENFQAPWKCIEINCCSDIEIVTFLRSNISPFAKQLYNLIPLHCLRVSLAALQNFIKVKLGAECFYNEKIIRYNSKIKLTKGIMFIFHKFAEAGITDFEHFLNGEGNYLTYDELVFKCVVAPSNSDLSHFIRSWPNFQKNGKTAMLGSPCLNQI